MSALNKGRARTLRRKLAVSAIKIIFITLVFIISLLFFGRFMF